jgi:protein arginine kinase
MTVDGLLIGSVALSRNEATTAFPHAADSTVLVDLLGRVSTALTAGGQPGEWEMFELDAVSPIQRAYLVERGLMTPTFSRGRGEGRGFAVYQGGRASLEVNGLDHIHLLGSRVGGHLSEAWATLDAIDDVVEAAITYAFDDAWGYLTSRPADAGTGVRAYATVHIPGLMVSGQLGGVAMNLISQSLVLAPLWEGAGGFFQVSNRGCQGTSELLITETVTAAANEIDERERSVRKALYRDHPVRVRDHIGRALGVAQQAWSVTAGEAVSLASAVWVGVTMGVVDAPWMGSDEALALMRRVQPGHLAVEELGAGHGGLDDPRIDEVRARILREAFADVRVCT